MFYIVFQLQKRHHLLIFIINLPVYKNKSISIFNWNSFNTLPV